MKRQLKQVAENTVAALAPLAWRLRRGPRLLVLMYHRVLPGSHPDVKTEQPGMFVSPQTFAMHLDVLKRHNFHLIHLDDWLRAAATGEARPARACSITFDDGWRDNYDHAFPLLQRANAPATVYLVSDLVGTQYSFWPNSLARVLAARDAGMLERFPEWLQQLVRQTAETDCRALSTAQVDAIISACKSRSDAEMLDIVRQHEAQPQSRERSERDLMSWDEIREMVASGLIRIGSHTQRHTRLSGVHDAEVLREEIVGSRESIAQSVGTAPATFCYPNGETSHEAIELVRATYAGAVTTERGWHSSRESPFLIRRINLHEASSNRPASFLARISDWL